MPNIIPGLLKKTQAMNMRKNDMISYMIKHRIEILSLPVKPVLVQKIHEANIPKKYIVDEMALDAEYSFLRFSSYQCVFKPIEMVQSQLKHAWRSNIKSSQPSKVVNLICDVFAQKITVDKWMNNIAHIFKEESFLKWITY